jgi:hypothetical protein
MKRRKSNQNPFKTPEIKVLEMTKLINNLPNRVEIHSVIENPSNLKRIPVLHFSM